MKLSSESLLSRLESRWKTIVEAPFIGTRLPMNSYRRFVAANIEFSDALRRFENYRSTMNAAINDAQNLKAHWSGPQFQTDEQHAAFGWFLLERCSDPEGPQLLAGSIAQYALSLGATESIVVKGQHLEVRRATPEGVSVAIQMFVGPTHRYLIEHVENDLLLLHHFDRFATWTRWFGHEVLAKAIKDEEENDLMKKQWEERLKTLAAEWVFRDGLPITDIAREPNTASGNNDFVVRLGPAHSVVVEAKLLGTFGKTPYTKAVLKSAMSQLRSYLNDHVGDGFLVVFHNYDAEVSVVEGPNLRRVPGAGNSFELVFDGDRRIGLVIARLKPVPTPSASKAPEQIAYTDLV